MASLCSAKLSLFLILTPMAMMERLRMKTIGTSIMVVQDQTSYDKVGVVIGLSKKAHMVLAVNI